MENKNKITRGNKNKKLEEIKKKKIKEERENEWEKGMRLWRDKPLKLSEREKQTGNIIERERALKHIKKKKK